MEIKLKIKIDGKWVRMDFRELCETVAYGEPGVSISSYPRMMYTGMKTTKWPGSKTKGEEIYEGHIISVDEIDSSTPWMGKPHVLQSFDRAVVTWNPITLCYQYNPIKSGLDYKIRPHQMLCYGYSIKILGNIYDNEELLK